MEGTLIADWHKRNEMSQLSKERLDVRCIHQLKSVWNILLDYIKNACKHWQMCFFDWNVWQKPFSESNEDRQEIIQCYSYLTAICTQVLLPLSIQAAPGLYFAKRHMKKIAK